MKIFPVLADTGRLAGTAVNLLNAGWTVTMAAQLPSGGWTLPGQALTVFAEAPADQLNKPLTFVIELFDDEGNPAHFVSGPDGGQGPAVRVEHEVAVPPVPGAPDGSPGMATIFMELPPGTLLVAPQHRYIWRVSNGEDAEEIGFWVQAPPPQPAAGGTGPADLPPLR